MDGIEGAKLCHDYNCAIGGVCLCVCFSGWVGPPERVPQPAPELHPSSGGSGAAGSGRRGRFLALSFTSLVTVTSTTTSTTYSTDTATTVSVSVLCTAAAMNLETFYCAGG